MTTQQFNQPVSDLGFGPEVAATNNYPEGFVTLDQLEIERRMNLKIIEVNGGEV